MLVMICYEAAVVLLLLMMWNKARVRAGNSRSGMGIIVTSAVCQRRRRLLASTVWKRASAVVFGRDSVRRIGWRVLVVATGNNNNPRTLRGT